VIPGTFTPQRAEELGNELDRKLSQAVNRVRCLAGVVPGAPASLGEKAEEIVSELEELVAGLHADVEKRTDTAAVAR